MESAILAVGDELTSGCRLDTNSRFIVRRLTALPTEVVLRLPVGTGVFPTCQLAPILV